MDEQHTVDQKAFYLVGRNAGVCDIVLQHLSISRLHAAIVHHEKGATYLVDLRSAHGTFVDGMRLTALTPTLVAHGSVIKFGGSSRSYAFKSFESREQIAERVRARCDSLDPDERALQINTLLNAQIAHRLELSPSVRNGVRALSMDGGGSICGADPHLSAVSARKRSRGQSANSTTSSSDNSASATSSGTLDLIYDEDDVGVDETQGEPKRVHFTSSPPFVIPETPCGRDDVDAASCSALLDDMAVPVTPRDLNLCADEDEGVEGMEVTTVRVEDGDARSAAPPQ
jgi:pSer/pThr/pTyr-binding forkhead associated (FHA) protein